MTSVNREEMLRPIVRDYIAGVAHAALLEQLAKIGIAEPEGQSILNALNGDALTLQARATAAALRKRDWLLDAMESHRALLPESERGIPRVAGLSGEDFLRRHYAAGRPAILCGEMMAWPALSRWTPDYLRQLIGSTVVEYQGERNKNPLFEMRSNTHKRELPFDQFMDLISQPGAANDAYITANNSARNAAALAPLAADVRPLEKFLTGGAHQGMPWIGPAGTFTPLHHDLTDNFVAQVVGRKQVKLIPAADVGKMANHHHVYSRATDIEAAGILEQIPSLKQARIYDFTLLPGEILFIPIGWWHQVRSLDFSVTFTYTNFRWRNDWSLTYPRD